MVGLYFVLQVQIWGSEGGLGQLDMLGKWLEYNGMEYKLIEVRLERNWVRLDFTCKLSQQTRMDR